MTQEEALRAIARIIDPLAPIDTPPLNRYQERAVERAMDKAREIAAAIGFAAPTISTAPISNH